VYNGKHHFLSDITRQFKVRLAAPLKPTVREIYADKGTVFFASIAFDDLWRWVNAYWIDNRREARYQAMDELNNIYYDSTTNGQGNSGHRRAARRSESAAQPVSGSC
jgi:hypothetical protein